MPVAQTYSVALAGVEGHGVEIEADIENGLPGLLLAGLPDAALREARDRIMAVAILSAAGAVPPGAAGGVVFLGELGLDGRLRPVRGVLPAVAAAAAAGFGRVAVPRANAAEASVVPGVRVAAAGTLAGLLGWLRGDPADPVADLVEVVE